MYRYGVERTDTVLRRHHHETRLRVIGAARTDVEFHDLTDTKWHAPIVVLRVPVWCFVCRDVVLHVPVRYCVYRHEAACTDTVLHVPI